MSEAGSRRIDPDEEAGTRAIQRLESERIAWLTTVAADGTPQTSPIWFLWNNDRDGGDFLLYSLDSARIRNLAVHPRVALNLDGDAMGGDILVVEGTASIDDRAPSAAENPDYLAKYKPVMDDYGWTPEWFVGRYSVPVRIKPTKYRYW
jgi:PPOX class probable F420-dependent enzyme